MSLKANLQSVNIARGRAARHTDKATTHDKAHSRAARDTESDYESDETTAMDEYEIPALTGQRSLNCAVQRCSAGTSQQWWYTEARQMDPRRICCRCISKWPDLRLHFSLYDVTHEYGALPARKAASRLQAVVRRFTCMRMRCAAATKAQARLRCFSASTTYSKRRAASAALQAVLRRAVVRSWQRRAQVAAKSIQCAWRCMKAHRERTHAAQRIQALQRGRSMRARWLLQQRLQDIAQRLACIHAAMRIQRAWHLARQRHTHMQAACCIQAVQRGRSTRAWLRRARRLEATRHTAAADLQAAVRRHLSVPVLKIGARVRLTAKALDVDEGYDWSSDALTIDTFGTVVRSDTACALVESDDMRRPNVEYWCSDLQPIMDGEPTSACACERARHAQRHAAAERIQAVRRGWIIRQQRATAMPQHCLDASDAQQHRLLHTSAPAFIFRIFR